MREQLLGYLLGALEPEEAAQLEARLAEDPELRRELDEVRRTLEPLDEDDADLAPPSGLAQRTCGKVREFAGWGLRPEWSASTGSWSVQDLLVAAGIFVTASMLVFPAINSSRNSARVTSCEANLAMIGAALHHYADVFGGYFPDVPVEGATSVAGIYAPKLLEMGYLSDARYLHCPGSSSVEDYSRPIPTVRQLQRASEDELVELQRQLSPSYGYHPGFFVDGRYFNTRNQNRWYFALVADTPDYFSSHGSANHGFELLNVLMEDGRVMRLIRCHRLENGDDIFVNEQGERGAGRNFNDSSIQASATHPLSFLPGLQNVSNGR